ncbi:hypothetical protein HOO65_030938 [Ceratocystis lukuohia]|uniref:Uncharacterized protein n=1 Tax=Ceratocystis lukuohia TaxID=2019550 RepID=A0ABR4MMB3_9PEZI
MWLPGFSSLVFMISICCTLIAAKDDIHEASDLGLEFFEPKRGWMKVTSPDGFFAEVYISAGAGYVAVSGMINGNSVTSYEALLSTWKHEAGNSAAYIREIKYYVDRSADITTLDKAFREFDYKPEEEDEIPEISIKRGTRLYGHLWESLRGTSYGSDAINICTEFEETDGLYIESIDFGRSSRNARWIKFNFAG